MSMVVTLVISAIGAGFALALVIVGGRAMQLARQLHSARKNCDAIQGENHALVAKLAAAQEADRKKIGWLDHQEQEINWLWAELKKRPQLTRKTYKILTLGVKATGKTSLALKWANPLIDLGTVEGTKVERYERTVSHVVQSDTITEHVFEVHDWGGEHIVDAQQELIVEEIHGLLVVVDLGSKNAEQVEPGRIHEQIQEFQPQSLKYFFSSKTLASCKTVVLFINKSDLLSGSPAVVEEQAKRLYAPLIEALNKYSTQTDVRVFVGSASHGHATHLLFSHFVEKILPKNAYDSQLLQRMKSDFVTTREPGSALPVAPVQASPARTAPLLNGKANGSSTPQHLV